MSLYDFKAFDLDTVRYPVRHMGGAVVYKPGPVTLIAIDPLTPEQVARCDAREAKVNPIVDATRQRYIDEWFSSLPIDGSRYTILQYPNHNNGDVEYYVAVDKRVAEWATWREYPPGLFPIVDPGRLQFSTMLEGGSVSLNLPPGTVGSDKSIMIYLFKLNGMTRLLVTLLQEAIEEEFSAERQQREGEHGNQGTESVATVGAAGRNGEVE